MGHTYRGACGHRDDLFHPTNKTLGKNPSKLHLFVEKTNRGFRFVFGFGFMFGFVVGFRFRFVGFMDITVLAKNSSWSKPPSPLR